MPIQPINGVFWATLLAALVLAGCEASNPSGRMGVSETNIDEAESPKALPAVLVEFSDQVARQLTSDIAELPRLREGEEKATILFGNLKNQTQVTSTNDFELMTARLRDNLINSEFARKHVRFFADRDRMRRLARQQEVGSKQGFKGPDPYDPNNTFMLNGDFYRLRRGDVNQYYLRFELVHAATGETIFSNAYDSKQLKVEDY